MKRFLSEIFLTILLTCAICSCRSSKQSSFQYSDTTSVSAAGSVSTLSKDEILSLISASRELDLSGIKVEFFPPDSVHPDTRAAPKSLTIETAKAKESTEQATKETAAVDEQKTVNLSAQSAASLQQDTQSDNDFLRPSDWVIFVSVLGAIPIVIFSIIFTIKHK
jgi:hypothetical protein